LYLLKYLRLGFCFLLRRHEATVVSDQGSLAKPLLMLAWVTNVSTSPDLYIEFSTEYTQSPVIRTSCIRTDAEFLGKFKNRALGSSNLRTTSKNLRTASAQIFKAKNRVLLPFLIHIFHLYIHKKFLSVKLRLRCSEQWQLRWLKFWFNMYSKVPNNRPVRLFRTYCYFKRERQCWLFLLE
jgi:hypothetical protein